MRAASHEDACRPRGGAGALLAKGAGRLHGAGQRGERAIRPLAIRPGALAGPVVVAIGGDEEDAGSRRRQAGRGGGFGRGPGATQQRGGQPRG